MTHPGLRAFFRVSAAVAALSGCMQTGGTAAPDASAPVARAASSTRLVERDVEAPQVFQASDQALWDGRPSLGGVWVASPDAVDPERVILRNPGNGKFVIGALFRRERLNPGPALQISSDAAAALGILAGQPTELNVTALRREEVADGDTPLADAAAPASDPVGVADTTTLAAAAIDRAEGRVVGDAPASGASPAIAATPLPAAASAGTAAPDTAADDATVAVAAAPAAPAKKLPFWKRGKKAAAAAPDMPLDARAMPDMAALPGATAPVAPVAVAPLTPAAPPVPSAGSGGLIQIGIFAVEPNARRAVEALAKGGVTARVLTETSHGKTFWRVVADPAGDRAATLAKAKAAGFTDAYPLKG